ncbi:MAG: Crp/Fnr family transcriptional regulator [Deltaproteobacteria bacterium]|nr:Crp/Fnr family transcriptional regulator [Deltaproteobacteria bacterium]
MARLSLEEKRRILARVPLFARLTENDVEAIASVSTTRSIKVREELFHKGDEGTQLYVVAQGRLKVVTTSDEGDDLIFCVLGPGEVVGEVGLLADRPRTATVIAMQSSDLIVIDRRELGSLLRTRPDVAIELLAVVAARLVRVSEFLEDTHFLSLPVRLAKKLVDFSLQHGKDTGPPGAGHLRIDLKLSQEEWGDLVGTTRESINKQFRAWTKEGLIDLEKGKVVILDLGELEKLADCVVI